MRWGLTALGRSFNSLLRDQLYLSLEFSRIKSKYFQFSLARSAASLAASVFDLALSILSCEISYKCAEMLAWGPSHFQFSLARSGGERKVYQMRFDDANFQFSLARSGWIFVGRILPAKIVFQFSLARSVISRYLALNFSVFHLSILSCEISFYYGEMKV